MRVFQNYGTYAAYLPRFNRLARGARSFAARRDVFLADRYGSAHLLKPVLEGDPQAFFTNGDDVHLQRAWGREQGLPSGQSLEQLLLMQLEAHGGDIFYNLDPMRYGSDFVRKLPGCVRRSIAWRAAPSGNRDFSEFDLVVCNFPGILAGYQRAGWRSAYFSPAHDPVMDEYSGNQERPIDVLFVGGYTRHHRRRAVLLETIATLSNRYRVEYRVDRSRLTRLAESPLGFLPKLSKERRPAAIRAVSAAPVFGRQMYQLLSQSKIVLNCAIDMAGDDRGNMRCFEALGCGALLVTDQGNYPHGMRDRETIRVYRDPDDALSIIGESLRAWDRLREVASAGNRMVREEYSKERQWQAFCGLVESLG